ncbi:minor histocompatibility antigen H13 [Anarrhichthys ocellatus]|uniref:minor histocompatibility antigen H13 n=1 Tax=Anarrhichthys ocellatus TaxID=433405 RepID=UPI0012ED6B53|nr:minor histocompatibility antigen H13 [Anarrhichthys ocellatus]
MDVIPDLALASVVLGELGENEYDSGFRNASDMPETITGRDAARFPIIASCTLFGLYLFFKVFSQEYINMLLSVYFFGLGVLALSHTMSPLMSRIFPESFSNKQYQLLFTQGSEESREEIVNYEFDTKNLICLIISTVVGVWYLVKKHWIANNLFGLAFALNGVELLHLNNVSTGCILLGGLFVYDVFWVRLFIFLTHIQMKTPVLMMILFLPLLSLPPLRYEETPSEDTDSEVKEDSETEKKDQ